MLKYVTIFINSCYSKIVRIWSVEKMERKGLVTAKELACYISNYYNTVTGGKVISPIKLQKSLYFCFAYWGGFVRKSHSNNVEVKINKSDWLFDDRIEAWVYGPVVPEVYRTANICAYNNDNLFKDNDDVKEFVDGIIDDLKDVSDFKLVEVSHSDNCWRKNFNSDSSTHNNEIDKEDIISEYAKIY